MIEKRSHRTLNFILMGIAYIFLMAGNGIVSLTHPDEVFYVQTAKEMMTTEHYLTPYLFDQPQFEKPIFTYWLLIVAIKLFGLTAFAARFWPAIFGMGGVMATYWLAVLLFQSKRTAFLSALILSTSLIYLILSRAVLTDMIFSIWVVLALIFFYRGCVDQKTKDTSIIFCIVFSALAVLTKGLLGISFPFGVIFAYLWYKRDKTYFQNKATILGILLFVAIAVPWHMLMIRSYGQWFIDEYFRNVHIRRIFEAEHLKSNTWYFYPLTILGGVFPWSLFLLPAGYLAYRSLKIPNPDKDKIAFLIIWITVIVFMMQMAQSKLASYIFPVFPTVAILIGYYFDKVLRGAAPGHLQLQMKVCSYATAILVFAGAILAVVYAKNYSQIIVDMRPVYIFSLLTLLLAIVLFVFVRRRQLSTVIGTLPFLPALMLLVALLGHHYAEPWVSCKQICDVLKKIDQSPSRILCSKFYVRGVQFYTDRKTAVIDINGTGFFSPHPIPFLNHDTEVMKFLSSQPVTYCIVKKNNVSDIKRVTGERFTVTIVDQIGGKYLLVVRKIAS